MRRLTFRLASLVALGGILSGAILAVRWLSERNTRLSCEADLRMLGLALLQYHEGFGSFPPGTLPDPMRPPERRLSWVVAAWAFGTGAPQTNLTIDCTRGWDEPPNLSPTCRCVTCIPPEIWPARPLTCDCPADPLPAQPGSPALLAYVGIAGLGPDAPELPRNHIRAGIFGYDRVTRVADITDGPSNTMMVVETRQNPGPWTAGGVATIRGVDPATRPYLGPGRPFGGYHKGGTNVLFADGSVRFVRNTVSPATFEALSTIQTGPESGTY